MLSTLKAFRVGVNR